MPFKLPDSYPAKPLGFDQIIDVRSPAEFAEDHMPGAINLPVLSNEERARVGTIYVQDNSFDARKIGAALVARNAAHHLETALAGKPGNWRPLVYCWRGGQRSGSFTSILTQVGWRAEVLEGGYRSYRSRVVKTLYETPLLHRMILLDGYTGTAKTDLLYLLAARGHQVLDLEGLANHRGSLFGGMSGGQPAQKGFESALLGAIAQFDPARPIIAEAESNKIGDRILPPAIWAAMRAAPRLEVAAPLHERAAYTLRRYPEMAEDATLLDSILQALVPYHGYEAVAGWQALAASGQFLPLVARLMEHHYDPRYRKARAAHSNTPDKPEQVSLDSLSPDALERATGEIETRLKTLSER